MAKDLRLLLFSECNRRCKGCCNKDWDLVNLPILKKYKGFKTVMLTGGEPMLRPSLIKLVACHFRAESPKSKLILYTAKSNPPDALIDVLGHVDGLTLTLHTRKDVPDFKAFQAALARSGIKDKSLRLNVFHGISLKDVDTTGWVVKTGIKWIKDCPLPKNEVFMRWY